MNVNDNENIRADRTANKTLSLGTCFFPVVSHKNAVVAGNAFSKYAGEIWPAGFKERAIDHYGRRDSYE